MQTDNGRGLRRRLFMQASVSALAGLAFSPAAAASERTDELAGQARKEGALVLYSNMPPSDNKDLLAGFQERYNIPVTLWRGGSEEITQRALAEARAGRVSADFILNNSAGVEALRLENLLAAVETPVWKELRSQAAPPHRQWAGFGFNLLVAARNTNLISAADLPRTFQDLLNPKWKGKLGIEADDSDWFGGIMDVMGEDTALKLFQAIARRNGLSVRKGHSLLANLVVSGEVPLALTVFSYTAEVLKQSGAPIDWFSLDPLVAMPNCVAVTRTAAHPKAAALFFDYMLTDAQDILARLHYLCANRRIPLPIDEARMHMLDVSRASTQAARWRQIYKVAIRPPT